VEIPADRQLRRARVLGGVGATALATGGLTAGALPWSAPFRLAPADHAGRGLTAAGMIAALAGLALMIGAWVRIRHVIAGRPKSALLTVLCWAAPLAVAPPLFSRDVYSYLAQGALVERGFDAYAVGPAALGTDSLVIQVHPMWLSTPAPYGPVFLAMAAGIVGLTGTHLLAGIMGMRLVAVASLAALVFVLPRLSAKYGVDPGRALWLGALNPLLLVHVVAGAHNDALMVALLVAGLLAARIPARGWELPVAVLLVTLATLVKAPAALALPFLLPPWRAGIGRFSRDAAVIVAVALATVAAVTFCTGLGLGWLGALGTPTVVHNGLSLSTDLGHLIGWSALHAGLGAHTVTLVIITRMLGLAAAGVVTVYTWLRRERLGLPAAVGLGLGAVVLLGPIVHPWYLLWGLAPLAAGTVDRRLVTAAGTLSVVMCLVLLPHGVSLSPGGVIEGLIGLAIGGSVLVATREVGKRQPVPVEAQPADHAGGHRRDDRVPPELLAGVDVGDVHLDQRSGQHRAGIPQRV
jgi:hypothetical protein